LVEIRAKKKREHLWCVETKGGEKGQTAKKKTARTRVSEERKPYRGGDCMEGKKNNADEPHAKQSGDSKGKE